MIEVRGLTKRFGATVAVDRLSFDVRPGVVTGFLGPNGAGKSTTMRMILGLDAPDAGSARIDGRDYRAMHEPLRRVGALLESDSFHPGRSARNHLRVAATTNGIPMPRVDEVLDQVGLTSVARRRVKGFSLGMRQRLSIATALLGDPPVLLFDEPVNGLDADGVRWVRHLVRGLAAEGRTVLVSSHLLSEMQQTADHLIVIGRGRLVADASTNEVLAAAGGRAVRVRTDEPGVLADALRRLGASVDVEVEVDGAGVLRVAQCPTDEIGRAARHAGVAVYELAEVETSLEQAYLQLTADSLDYAVPATEGLRR